MAVYIASYFASIDIVVLFKCIFDQTHSIFNCLLPAVKFSTGVSTTKLDAKRVKTKQTVDKQTVEGTVWMGGMQMLDWLSAWTIFIIIVLFPFAVILKLGIYSICWLISHKECCTHSQIHFFRDCTYLSNLSLLELRVGMWPYVEPGCWFTYCCAIFWLLRLVHILVCYGLIFYGIDSLKWTQMAFLAYFCHRPFGLVVGKSCHRVTAYLCSL